MPIDPFHKRHSRHDTTLTRTTFSLDDAVPGLCLFIGMAYWCTLKWKRAINTVFCSTYTFSVLTNTQFENGLKPYWSICMRIVILTVVRSIWKLIQQLISSKYLTFQPCVSIKAKGNLKLCWVLRLQTMIWRCISQRRYKIDNTFLCITLHNLGLPAVYCKPGSLTHLSWPSTRPRH